MIDLDSHYPISDDVIAAFRKDGFVRLKNVLSAEALAYYGPAITQQVIALNTQTAAMEDRTTYEKAFLQVMNLWLHDNRVKEFVFSKRLARIAADLLEVDGVRLYHDQALYKEPSGGFTPAHADQYYWPLATDRTVTVWIPLQAVSAEMGPLGFYAGSQKAELGRDIAISDESEAAITTAMEAENFPMHETPFDLGEVSFHCGWIFHRAGPNLSTAPRGVMTMIYMDQNMKLAAPKNANQQNDWDSWCKGAVIGGLIDGPENPVLYP